MSYYFDRSRLTSLDTLSPGAAIHIIGVCGVAMAPLALALASRGFRVSGSDREYFEPMGSRLRASSISLCMGFHPSHIPQDVSLVILGNTAKQDNVEVQETIARQLPYSIFPQLLYELLIRDRHSVVVAGTHGKSTTTTLLATLFSKLGAKPSWFVGGQPVALASWHEDDGTVTIVEGDEYISSFFSPVPKFTYYHPHTLIVNAVELDHVDVYPDLQAIQAEFTKLVYSVPKWGHVVVAIDDRGLQELALHWRSSGVPVVTFGSSDEADVQLVSRDPLDTGRQVLRVESRLFGNGEWELPLTGRHNALNSVAAWTCARLHGFSTPDIALALSQYQGLKRRQQVLFHGTRSILIEDFAHHPTSIKETLEGLREHYPDYVFWALYEPRTASNRRGVFLDRYADAFSSADHVLILDIPPTTQDVSALNTRAMCDALLAEGIDASSFSDPYQLLNSLFSRLSGKDLVIVMSSGPFGGVIPNLERELRQREM